MGYCLSESVNICCEHGILMIALPANETHIFQPLDVAVFKPFKQSSASVYSFKCMKRRTQSCPNRQPSRLRAMHTAAPSLSNLAMQSRASGVLDSILSLWLNYTSVSVSIKLGKWKATLVMHHGLFATPMWSPQSRMRSSLSLQSLYASRRSVEQRSTSQAGCLPKKCLQKHPASSRALNRYPVKRALIWLIFSNSQNFEK